MNNVVTRISTPYSTGPLPCPYGCGRSFKHATQKAIHVRKAHTGERPFVCSHEGCGRAFHSSGDLKSHERTHSGAREHICGTCGKALSSRNALKVHERALHTLDRPFKCEVPGCGMTYMTRLDLDRHANKHAKNKAKEEAAKLALLEKRAAKAERQGEQLREKLGKLEKREKKTHAAGAAGAGNENAPEAPFLSPAEVEGALDAKSIGALVELSPVPPPGAVAYLVLSRDGPEEGAPEGGDRGALDDLAVVRKRDASAAVAAAAAAAAAGPRARKAAPIPVGGARVSRGAAGNTAASSHLTSTVNSDGGAGGDPTVQGVFAARDALAGARPPAKDDSGDDEPLAALARGAAPKKRARPAEPADDSVKQERGGKLTKRRVLERMLREAYEAATTGGTVPFQSWRRGLPKAEAERLEALAEAEATEARALDGGGT